MRVLVATDAWRPQINGVVRSLENVAAQAPACGAEVRFLTPSNFPSAPLPTYREIRLALASPARTARAIAEVAPDCIHIATEGPVGLAVRRHCLARNRPFTTSYHTRFPEYLAARLPVPRSLTYAFLRRFHNAGAGAMVSSATLESELSARGFRNLMRWSRGVDAELFRPRPRACPGADQPDAERPVFLTVGRVAVEKNIAAFLDLDLPGTKVVIGDGPALGKLARAYPRARFLGALSGEALAEAYAAADCFVFPSLTDTFGIVLLEALASGVPVAAFPVMGPLDVIGDSGCGVLDHDLRAAALAALDVPRQACRAHALRFTWAESARQFFANVRLAHERGAPAAASRARGQEAAAAALR